MLKTLFALGLGLGLAAGASAQAPTEWQEGKHYTLIEPAQVTTTGDKVEVLEVFSYAVRIAMKSRHWLRT
ncbi:hypothetical protein [Dokdonella sp.]|uniref:hypothetical protein n=1 Tax=Dokdonella sp. TaxID=2291710 RepID=UPI003528C93D